MEALPPTLKYRIPVGKRLFDILFSGATLLVLSPVFMTIIVLMKILSKGPIFYKSKRVGTNYKIFDFYKFRSMEIGADKKLSKMAHLNQYKDTHYEIEVADRQCDECVLHNTACSNLLVFDDSTICEKVYLQQKKHKAEEAFIKISNDPRVTKFGQFLRNTSLDELPQLLNVLKGDMSIVGNRPLPLYEAEKLTTDQKVRRFMAPSGITGLWQVTKRGNSSMSAEERVLLDIYYAKKYSMRHDLYILLRTIPAMFQKDNV